MTKTSYLRKFAEATYRLIIGVRPHNTVFSFNYLNISRIVQFHKRSASGLNRVDLVTLDVGGGNSPYQTIYSDNASIFLVVDLLESLPPNQGAGLPVGVAGQAESLPVASGSVDLVLCNEVLEHVLDERATIEEIFRVLKPGGVFIGSVPHISPIHLEPFDFRRFTALGIDKLLTDSGFIDIEIEGNGSVFRAAALLLSMDLVLPTYQSGKMHGFNHAKHLLMTPLIFLLNITGLVLEKTLPDSGRSPSNNCWRARKPIE